MVKFFEQRRMLLAMALASFTMRQLHVANSLSQISLKKFSDLDDTDLEDDERWNDSIL